MKYQRSEGIGLFSADERLSILQDLGDPLVTLSAHIDFEVFRKMLVQALYGWHDPRRGGRPPFDPVLMFKALVLQRLYNLSDDSLEFQINDRLSFMRFLGLDFGSRVPDAKTIWLFRDRLQKLGLVKKLFDGMNRQLERQGVIANQGQIVDASFVTAPRQRNSRKENAEIQSGTTPAEFEANPNKLCQKDMDARWTKKNGETYFGYKNHILCDGQSKLIKTYAVTHAAVHDSQALETLLDQRAAAHQTLHGDSAYRSESIEKKLVRRRIESRIHEKGYRDRPLTTRQIKSNRRKSRVRARIEHVFAFMSGAMGGMTVRSRSLRRNETVIGLMNLTYNLCRMMQLGRSLEMAEV